MVGALLAASSTLLLSYPELTLVPPITIVKFDTAWPTTKTCRVACVLDPTLLDAVSVTV